MRFDDRLTTILDSQPADERGRAAAWIQLVDLLAQDKGQFSEVQRQFSIERLSSWRSEVPERRRLASSVSIAGRALAVDLVAFFAADTAQVAAPILTRTNLSGAQWAGILTGLPRASRAILRERRDLPAETVRALGSFGSSDLALTDTRRKEPMSEKVSTSPPASAPEQAEEATIAIPIVEQPNAVSTSINALVERIDNWRHRRASGSSAKRAVRQIVDFAFETDVEGVINWVEGAPRGGLIGISIAMLAETGGGGVDGQAAGAFRKRAEIREAPLLVAGATPVSGDWLLIADPRFDAETGRFLGYRGLAQRPRTPTSIQEESGLPAGSIRQLVHELRTPLNAIRGFGEMIEGQFLGPVAVGYRNRARTIVHDSGELLRVFEDLDANARLESSDYPMSPDATVDLSEIVRAVASIHADLVEQRGIRLRIALPAREGQMLGLDRASALRMVDRMLGAALSTTEAGDVAELSLHVTAKQYELAVGRTDRPEREDDSDAFAPLGLDFSLRLAARLAERCGGRLERQSDSFRLLLPQMQDSALVHGERT